MSSLVCRPSLSCIACLTSHVLHRMSSLAFGGPIFITCRFASFPSHVSLASSHVVFRMSSLTCHRPSQVVSCMSSSLSCRSNVVHHTSSFSFRLLYVVYVACRLKNRRVFICLFWVKKRWVFELLPHRFLKKLKFYF